MARPPCVYCLAGTGRAGPCDVSSERIPDKRTGVEAARGITPSGTKFVERSRLIITHSLT